MFKNLFKKLKKPKQTCFVYCPKCKNELISSGSFVEDNDGIVKYKCSGCGNGSFFVFIHYPVPYLRTCASDCKHFYIDETGHDRGCLLKSSCSPDTMVEFEPRGWASEKLIQMANEAFCDLDISDLKITVGERRYIWDSEKKEFIDISKESEE